MLTTLDIVILALYFALSIGIGIYYSRRAGKNTEEFFLSGRNLPWWIAGTAMVATTFAADTPLAVTELVAAQGIAGNWLWWNMLAGSVLTVFFFAKLWRRANILTDVEFIEIRYSGKPAAFLRGFRALYLGVFMNCIIMGWVNVALAEILSHIFGIREYVFLAVILCMCFVGIYSALSGAWGIVITDFVQFIIAMGGCIVLAVVVLNVPRVGGISGLMNALPENTFSFFPHITSGSDAAAAGVLTLSFGAFVAHIAVQWWSSWYPGSEPGGGGYVAQRMMSAKDERHSVLATLWFTIANYALRPWPWIIVALASLVLYPDLPSAVPEGADSIGYATTRTGFVFAMRDFLPPGLLGLLVAAFLAAYMSTIATHLNWGTSYIINDFYRRFIARGSGERHYVVASRVVTLFLVMISSLLVYVIQSISGAWLFIIECGAGLGLVLIIRWYWWRINAWSEIVAMVVPFGAYIASRFYLKLHFPESLFFIVAVTTVAWITATFITPPVKNEVLQKFFDRVRPGGPGWRGFRSAEDPAGESLIPLGIDWLLGIVMIYCALFSIGKIIFQSYLPGFLLLGTALVLFVLINIRLKRRG